MRAVETRAGVLYFHRIPQMKFLVTSVRSGGIAGCVTHLYLLFVNQQWKTMGSVALLPICDSCVEECDARNAGQSVEEKKKKSYCDRRQEPCVSALLFAIAYMGGITFALDKIKFYV